MEAVEQRPGHFEVEEEFPFVAQPPPPSMSCVHLEVDRSAAVESTRGSELELLPAINDPTELQLGAPRSWANRNHHAPGQTNISDRAAGREATENESKREATENEPAVSAGNGRDGCSQRFFALSSEIHRLHPTSSATRSRQLLHRDRAMQRLLGRLGRCSFLLLASAAVAFSSLPLSPTRADDPSPHHTVPIHTGDLFADIGIDLTRTMLNALMSAPEFRPASAGATRAKAKEDAMCTSCVTFHGLSLLNAMRQATQQACSTFPEEGGAVLRDRCQWIARHPRELDGYMLARTTPFAYALPRCAAARHCRNSTTQAAEAQVYNFDYTRTYEPWSPEHLLQLASSVVWVERAMRESTDIQVADAKSRGALYPLSEVEVAAQHQASPTGLLDVSHLAKSTDRCHACLSHGIRFTMRRVLRHLKHECRATNEPTFLAWCTWVSSGDRRQSLRGVMFALVQPYLTAIGWCLGKDLCAHATIHADTGAMPFTLVGRSMMAERVKRVGEIHTRNTVNTVAMREPTKFKYWP